MENVRNDNLLSEFLWASAKQCVDYIKLWDCIPEKYNHLCKKYKVRSELLQAKYPIMPKSFINILLNEFRKINDNCGYMEIYVKNCCLIQLPSSLSIERKTI